jgi:hypothetical protein
MSVSDNVGCVNRFSNTRGHALDKSAISLYQKSAKPNQGSLAIVLGQELGPTHSSLRSSTTIMITASDSPSKGSRMPNQ